MKIFYINFVKKFVEWLWYEIVDVVIDESVFGIVNVIVDDCVVDNI